MLRSGCCSQFDCCSHNVCLLASASEIRPGESVMVKKLRELESVKWYFKQGGVVCLFVFYLSVHKNMFYGKIQTFY